MAELIRMPKLSLTMTAGRIEEWLKKEGDAVQIGDPLATIESDKTMFELPAPQAGILRRVLVEPGQEVAIEAPVAIIAGQDEDITALLVQDKKMNEAPALVQTAPSSHSVPKPASSPAGRQKVSPVARRVAADLGVDLALVAGTGDGGLVTEKDVRAYAASAPATPTGEDKVIPLSGVRRRMAERMALSRRTAADVTTIADVDMNQIAERRKTDGSSYTAYVAWAASRALREFPLLNSSLVDDRIVLKKQIHLGVAVALENALLVPVVRQTDEKSLEEIANEIDRLANLARKGQLPPDALAGSTFTITNSGAFGSLMFTPIINQPEVAILGMGKVADTPVVYNGEIVVRKLMYLCLSYDHRVVEGAIAVQFLQAVKKRLESPTDYLN